MAEQSPPTGYQGKIHDLPAEERPRERLRDQGPGALSSHELLAILLRTGTKDEDVFTLSKRLLAMRQGFRAWRRPTSASWCSSTDSVRPRPLN